MKFLPEVKDLNKYWYFEMYCAPCEIILKWSLNVKMFIAGSNVLFHYVYVNCVGKSKCFSSKKQNFRINYQEMRHSTTFYFGFFFL